jgi:hypothetical protein
MSKHEYEVNRKRVSEIFGLNPDEVSCHHICFRSDAKNKKSPLYKMDVDELSNLYPFPVDGPGHHSSEHIRTHELIERNEPQPNTKKRGTVYKRRR